MENTEELKFDDLFNDIPLLIDTMFYNDITAEQRVSANDTEYQYGLEG